MFGKGSRSEEESDSHYTDPRREESRRQIREERRSNKYPDGTAKTQVR